MKKNIDGVIFIPFCDKEYEMLMDTIKSIEYYVKEKFHIIAVDDFSPSRLDDRLRKEMPNITVLRNPKKHGGRSGLYVTQAIAAKHALSQFNFKVFIKMDTDALMVGSSIITESIRKFEEDPQLGILGSYKQRADGKRRNWRRWKVMFWYESSQLRRLLKKPVLWKSAIRAAFKNGYDLGENVLGGCYVINARCIQEMAREGYLDYEYEKVLNYSVIGDEIIFSMFCKAVGFHIGEFGRPEDPMVIALDIVPMPVEKIISDRKAVIHSVKKGYRNETQQELREFFRSLRK